MRSVPDGRPERLLLHVNRRPLACYWVGCADGGDDPTLRRDEEQGVRRNGRSAAADHHVHRSLSGVDHVGGGCCGDWGQRDVRFLAADRVRALVVVLMSTYHEIDAVL